MKAFPVLLVCLVARTLLQAQPVDENWLLRMVGDPDKAVLARNDSLLLARYGRSDSAARVQLLGLFNKGSGSGNPYTAARCLMWKGILLRRPPFNDPTAGVSMQQANNRAVESGDAYLQVQCFENYAADCMSQGKPETALFYYLKAAELRNSLNDAYFRHKTPGMYGTIGELLHKMQEYALSTWYIRQSFAAQPSGSLYASCYNTIGLNYQRLRQYDSAMYHYAEALRYAESNRDSVWAGIVSGNIGALYFEQGQDAKALPLLWKDYQSCLSAEPRNAGNTLQRIALIYLRRQQPDSALLLARQSLRLVQTPGIGYNPGYVRNVYGALCEVFKKTGRADSAFFYGDIYHHLKDSINQAIAANRADVAKVRLDFEKGSNQIQALLQEKQAEKMWRYLLLAALTLLLIAGWLYFRWQRQRHFNKQQVLLHQQQMAAAEIKNAQEKLEEFTQNSIEKNDLIEKLQEQLQQQNMQVNDALLNQSILTENDWLRFKEMFNKANPGFMPHLQSMAPNITTAEIRLAALIKLNLGNKHIASMLGIGTDAVRKTKSRLRQRLQIDNETELEDFIKTVQPGSGN
jgi:tetratricopeptide (TPR) repeat protein/DNA-binding NarL/FixJ family response regulator